MYKQRQGYIIMDRCRWNHHRRLPTMSKRYICFVHERVPRASRAAVVSPDSSGALGAAALPSSASYMTPTDETRTPKPLLRCDLDLSSVCGELCCLCPARWVQCSGFSWVLS